MDVRGRVAIITGASRGIGLAAGRELAAAGCRVALVARGAFELEEAVKTIEGKGGLAMPVIADLAKTAAAGDIVAAVSERWGPPDILVNNAGCLQLEAGLDSDAAVAGILFDETIGVNLRGAWLLARACLPAMMSRGEGYIVNLSSTVAFGTPGRIASYGMSKHGVAGLSEALRDIAKGSGVKISTIYPGITDTKMVRDVDDGDPDEYMLPEDIVACLMFLVSLGPRIIVKDLVPWATRRDRI